MMTSKRTMKEINDVQPTSLSHIIGQKHVVETLSVAIDAAFQDNKRLDDCLLVGPPGLGKSAICNVLIHEMAVPSQFVLAQSISGPGDLNAMLLSAESKSICVLDEAHLLHPSHQTALLLALDRRCIYVSGNKSVQSIPINDFTFVFATTDEHGLLDPLIQRLKIILRLQFLSLDDLAQVVRHRCRALGWELDDDDVIPEVAKRGKGTPRLALRIIQAARRCARAVGESTITMEHLQRACRLEQIDEYGLDITQQQYLRLLADGPMRVSVLASILGLAMKTVSGTVEPYLLRANFIYRDESSRRQLTKLGVEYVSNRRLDPD